MALVLNLVRQKMFDAAHQIQLWWRTDIKNEDPLERQYSAATKIQSIYRMHVERRQIKKDNREYAEAAALVIRMDSCAIKIQSIYHMYAVTRKIKKDNKTRAAAAAARVILMNISAKLGHPLGNMEDAATTRRTKKMG